MLRLRAPLLVLCLFAVSQAVVSQDVVSQGTVSQDIVSRNIVSRDIVAECIKAAPPVFSETGHADFVVIEKAQQDMKRYIKNTEDYLECAGTDLKREQVDAILKAMKHATHEYNLLLAEYRKHSAPML